MTPGKLARLHEPAGDPAARALVHEIRRQLVDLFVAHGAASNQIGKTYPYLSVLRPESRALLEGMKRQLDPGGALNPGALELSAG